MLDANMFTTVARLKVPYVLMHLRGTPQTMATFTQYENLIKEMIDYFHQKLYVLKQLNVVDVLIDPGFGFAKDVKQNFELLSSLSAFKMLGRPLLVGLSRKSMIWKTLNVNPEEALNGTTVLNTFALLQGASIVRVHDVRPAVEAIKLLANIQIGNSFDNFSL
jgi:dihydropteroate synthase